MRLPITKSAGTRSGHLAHQIAPQQPVVVLKQLRPQVHTDPEASRHSLQGTVEVGNVSRESTWASPSHVLIHFAAETRTDQSMYEQVRYRRVDVDGAKFTRDAAERRGAPPNAMSRDLPAADGPRTAAVGPSAMGSRPVHLRG
jgi:nucleoside-diphosphate-sugar epimerase